MFTSRAEHRLSLREDNADLRLTPIGYKIGLVDHSCFQKFCERRAELSVLQDLLAKTKLKDLGSDLSHFAYLGEQALHENLTNLGKRPDFDLVDVISQGNFPKLAGFPKRLLQRAAIETKYAGYVAREKRSLYKLDKLSEFRIPLDFKYEGLPGLSRELREKLGHLKPSTLGQASRMSGMTPAALQLLQVSIERQQGSRH